MTAEGRSPNACRPPELFGSGWQLELDGFARWIESGGIFGPLTPLSNDDSAGSTEGSVAAESVSATLGWLYLEQGHCADAEEIFLRVLRHSPGDPRALEGRHEVVRRLRVERKVARLRRFLARVERHDG